MPRLRKVRERNGAIVPFRQAKIAASIQAAVRDAGKSGEVPADELAGVVTLFLEKQYDDDNPPSLDDVRDMVAKVLAETGHVRIAQSYSRLLAPQASRASVEGVEIVGPGGSVVEAWHAATLAQSLLEDGALPEHEAHAIAVAVETKLITAGLARVELGLLREFVDVELASRGHADLLARSRLLGVPRRQLDQWLYPEGAPVDPEEAVAATVLEEYALQFIHSRAVALAHAQGAIHILGIGHPQRVEDVTLSTIGPAFGRCATGDELLLGLAGVLGAVRPLVRGRVILANFSQAFVNVAEKMTRGRVRKHVRRLLDHLLRIDVRGRSVYPQVVLQIELSPEGAIAIDQRSERASWTAHALLDELEERSALRGRVGLEFLLEARPPYAWPESDVLARLVTAARRHRGVALRLRRREALDVPSEKAVTLDVGAVAVNLPYVLARAKVRRIEDVAAALEPAIECALAALAERYWFLRRSAPETLRGVLANLAGGAELEIPSAGQRGQILLWGLPHAVQYLADLGEGKGDAAAQALARIIALVDYVVGEPREDAPLEVAIGGVAEKAVRRRFLEASGALVAAMADEPAARALARVPLDAPAFPIAAPILSATNRGVLASPALRRLGTGLPLPARGADELANGVWLRHLFESTKLEYFEMEEKPDAFEVQETLFA
jgi:hypothetical protein